MELTLKGEVYRLSKLSVFEQLKVARKLLPVLAGMLTDFQTIREKMHASEGGKLIETLAPKIADAVAGLSDQDVDAILFPCLQVVSRQHMKAWVPVCRQGEMAFDDLDLSVMLQLVARVVADSLGNFLQELPTSVTPSPKTA